MFRRGICSCCDSASGATDGEVHFSAQSDFDVYCVTDPFVIVYGEVFGSINGWYTDHSNRARTSSPISQALEPVFDCRFNYCE